MTPTIAALNEVRLYRLIGALLALVVLTAIWLYY